MALPSLDLSLPFLAGSGLVGGATAGGVDSSPGGVLPASWLMFSFRIAFGDRPLVFLEKMVSGARYGWMEVWGIVE